MNQGVILNRFRPNLGHFKNETILSEGLQRTIDLEQRAIADGGVPVDRNNTVNSIPYTLLKLNPSIVIGPDAYKDGKIHAIIPNDGSADLDVTRGSITTAFDKDSKVVRMPYNYLNNSIVSTWNQSVSGFNLTPTTLLGMDALTVENISGASQSSSTSTNRVEGAQLSLPIEIGETYTYSFIIEANNVLGEVIDVWIFGSSPSSVRLQVNLNFITGSYMLETPSGFSNENIRSTNISGNVYLVEITAESTVESLLRRNDFTAYNDTGSFTISNPQVNRGIERKQYLETTTGLDTPMITYVDGRPVIGSHTERTNLIEHRELGNTGWTSNGTISYTYPLSTIAPTVGLGNMTIATANGSINDSSSFSAVVADDSLYHSMRIMVETAELANLRIIFKVSGGTSVVNELLYDASGNVVTNTGSFLIETLSNGWTRIVNRVQNNTSGNTLLELEVFPDYNAGTGSTTLDLPILVSGFMPTNYPYILTEGATATRFKDILKKLGIGAKLGQTEGSLTAYVNVKTIANQNQHILEISDGTINNRVYIRINSAGEFELFRNSPTQSASTTITTAATTGTHKLEIKYKSGQNEAYLNDVLVGSDVNTFSGNAFTQYNLGCNYADNDQFNNYIEKCIIKDTF